MVGSWLPIQVFQSIEYKESFVVAAYISGPKWSSKKSTSYRRVAQWQKSCGQALQEPLPSCHWFAISVSWRLVTLFLSLPFQLRKSQTPLPTHCCLFSSQHFHWLAPNECRHQTYHGPTVSLIWTFTDGHMAFLPYSLSLPLY